MSNSRCACPACGRIFSVPADVLGKQSKCPHCRALLTLESIGGKTVVRLTRLGNVDPAKPRKATSPKLPAKPQQPTETWDGGATGVQQPNDLAAASTAFDFGTNCTVAPRANRTTPRKPRHPLSVPIWGTFLFLVLALLGAAGWGGWQGYCRWIRHPRMLEKAGLFAKWREVDSEGSSRDRIESLRRAIPYTKRTRRILSDDKLFDVPAEGVDRIGWENGPAREDERASINQIRKQCEHIDVLILREQKWLRENRQERLDLEKEAQQRFGESMLDIKREMFEYFKSNRSPLFGG